jgi:transposase
MRGVAKRSCRSLRRLLRVLKGRAPPPTATSLDACVLPSSPESGARAGYKGHTRRTGSQVHAAGDPLGQRLALVVPPANADERPQVAALAAPVQAVTAPHVAVTACVEQGAIGAAGAAGAAVAAARGIHLAVVQLPDAPRGCVRVPRRWVVERSCAWTARFRRLARVSERLPGVLAGLHVLAFACLMLHQLIHLYSSP